MPDRDEELGNIGKICGKQENKVCKNDLPEDVSDIPQILETFDVLKKVGSGTFSSVCLAKLKVESKRLFAIKYIVPTTHPSRTAMELSCLIDFGGKDNILPIYTCVRHLDRVAIVMPYFHHDEFKNYVKDLNLHELQLYIWNLLVALRRVHAAGIIHRDVKPRNFLFNRESKQFALIDFGLAQKVSDVSTARCSIKRKSNENKSTDEHSHDLGPGGASHPKKPMGNFNDENLTPKTKQHLLKGATRVDVDCKCYNRPQVCKKCLARPSQQACRAGTPGYRPPEVLMKYVHQTTAVDIWATGVIFITLISGRYPFFDSSDDMSCLRHVTRLLGSNAMKKAASAIGKSFLCSPAYRPSNMKGLCQRLRKSRIKERATPQQDNLSDGGEANNETVAPKSDCDEDTEIITLDNDAANNFEENTEIVNYPQAADSTPNTSATTVSYSPHIDDSSPFKDNIDTTDLLPDTMFDLLEKMLDPNPLTRITAEESLRHAYFSGLDCDGL